MILFIARVPGRTRACGHSPHVRRYVQFALVEKFALRREIAHLFRKASVLPEYQRSYFGNCESPVSEVRAKGRHAELAIEDHTWTGTKSGVPLVSAQFRLRLRRCPFGEPRSGETMVALSSCALSIVLVISATAVRLTGQETLSDAQDRTCAGRTPPWASMVSTESPR